MLNRELALTEIYNRLTASKDVIGLKAAYKAPASTIDTDKLPSVSMFEGPDEVMQVNSRGVSIYPARRLMEVVLELSASDTSDIKSMYQRMRLAILESPVVAHKTFISEIRTEGPMGYEIPNTQGMRLVLALVYTDTGPTQ